MTIVSSSLTTLDLGAIYQVDEEHTDNVGIVHRWRYHPAKSVDINAKLALHAAEIDARLVEQEAESAIERDAAPTLNYQTGAQFLQRLREIYRESDKERCARIARWIINRLDAGHVTVAQLRNAFELTAQQWSALEAKLRALKASIESVDAAAGE